MRAGGRFRGHRFVGMASQRTATPFATQAACAWSDALGLLRLVRLLSFRWRQAGIVRCLDGSPSLASSAVTRAVRLCTCAHSARIRASFSAWLRWLRSGSWVTPWFRIDSAVTVSKASFCASQSVDELPLKPGSSRYGPTASGPTTSYRHRNPTDADSLNQRGAIRPGPALRVPRPGEPPGRSARRAVLACGSGAAAAGQSSLGASARGLRPARGPPPLRRRLSWTLSKNAQPQRLGWM